MAVANTYTYETLFEDVLQDRLDHPTTYKEMCRITMTNTRAISTSYESTQPSVQTVVRDTALTMQAVEQTAETLTISTGRDLAVYVDLADEAQSPWTTAAEHFDRIGARLNEFIESNVLAQHASWTDFGQENLDSGTSGTTQITVSATNIDDIIRGVKTEIREANGQFFMNQNGAGFVWRAADFELLEAFVQANGFATADSALKAGTVEGLHYMGADHYWSNEHTANHVFAGVKGIQRLGILQSVFGRAYRIPFPAGDSNHFFSGTAYYSRVEIGHLTPTAHKGLVFDVNVA